MSSFHRNKLKSFFKNESQLSAASFVELIDAALIHRDDQFYGKWEVGQAYRPGDVVIYQRQLWEMSNGEEICAKAGEAPTEQRPGDWKPFIDDNDWAVLTDESTMWAKAFDKVGIGMGLTEKDLPRARLDVRKLNDEPTDAYDPRAALYGSHATVETSTEDEPEETEAPEDNEEDLSGTGRWLLFPETTNRTQHTFLHYGLPTESAQRNHTSALITDLSLTTATWWSNASQGFAFCHSTEKLNESAALSSSVTDSRTMLSLRPHASHPADTAALGLNVAEPKALIEAVDTHTGAFLVLPNTQNEPTLTLQNQSEAYFSTTLNNSELSWQTNASSGFALYVDGRGEDESRHHLAQIRQHPTGAFPQVGIGTDEPQACLDVGDRTQTHIQLLPILPPEAGQPPTVLPTISIVQQQPGKTPYYLHAGLGEQTAGWVTDAARGYVFRQKREIGDPYEQSIDQGRTFLAIREDGRVGIGCEEPSATLEIAAEAEAGRLLFSPSPDGNRIDSPAMAIVNHRAGNMIEGVEASLQIDRDIIFTLGTQFSRSVLRTNAPEGFSFTATDVDSIDDALTTEDGQLLVSILPDSGGKLGIGKQPEDYALDVQGNAQAFNFYQAHYADWRKDEAPLADALNKIRRLCPITFNGTDELYCEGEQIGLRAEEVQPIFPQVVKTAENGQQSLAYQSLVPVLIQAVNELNEQNRKEHEFFEKYIEQLADRISVLSFGLLIGWIVFAIVEYWG